MSRILDNVCKIMAVAGCLLLLFTTFSIAYSIFARPLKLPSLIWVVQFNEYSLLWITFLGTGWVLSRDRHVSIQVLTHLLSSRMNKALALVHNILGFLLCSILTFYGAYTSVDHLQRKVIDVQSVDILKGLVIMVIPLGFFFLVLQFLQKIIRQLTAKTIDGKDSDPAFAAGKSEKEKKGNN